MTSILRVCLVRQAGMGLEVKMKSKWYGVEIYS